MNIAMTRFVRRSSLSMEVVNVFPLFYKDAFFDFAVLPVVIQLCFIKRWGRYSYLRKEGLEICRLS